MAIRKGSSYKDHPACAKTVGSRAFEHALDFELMILDRMEALGMKKSDLAKAMGISRPGLSNLLNSQPNMTLETMTRFEVALDATLNFSLEPAGEYAFTFDVPQEAGDEQTQTEDWDDFESGFANRQGSKVSFHLAAFSERSGMPVETYSETIKVNAKTVEEGLAA